MVVKPEWTQWTAVFCEGQVYRALKDTKWKVIENPLSFRRYCYSYHHCFLFENLFLSFKLLLHPLDSFILCVWKVFQSVRLSNMCIPSSSVVRRGHWLLWNWELQVVVSHPVCAGIWTWILYKSSNTLKLVSHLSRPYNFLWKGMLWPVWIILVSWSLGQRWETTEWALLLLVPSPKSQQLS